MAANYSDIKSTGVRLTGDMGTYSTRNSVVKLGIEILTQLIELKNKGIKCVFFTPADIYVSKDGDFVLAGVSQRPPEKTDRFSHLVQLYTAPEAYDRGGGDGAGIFSLGTIMYKLLNGGMEPFRTSMDFEGAVVAYKTRISGARVSAPHNADALLSAIIIKACEYDASKRYVHAEDMLDDLMLLADGNYKREAHPLESTEGGQDTKKTKKAPVIAVAIGTALILLAIIMLIINIRCNSIYVRADRYIRDGKLTKAEELLTGIKWYKDSRNRLLKCDLLRAEMLLDEGKTEKAIEILDKLASEDYDELGSITGLLLQKSIELSDAGNDKEAALITEFILSSDKGGTAQLKEKEDYQKAMELYDKGNFNEAKKIFDLLGDKEMSGECDYALASEYKQVGEYVMAMKIFASLYDYENSADDFEECEQKLLTENSEKEVFRSFKNMTGRYSNEDGYYVEYSKDGDKIKARYSLPFKKAAYFKFEDGMHYHSSDSENWEKQWIWEAMADGEFMVYDYIDKRVYTLTKE